MKNISLIIFFVSLNQIAYGGSQTLCSEDEVAVLSCAFEGGKFVSLCTNGTIAADGKASIKGDYLEYRYGKPGSIELTLPKKRTAPDKVFTGYFGYSTSAVAGNYINQRKLRVSIANGAYAYEIEDEYSLNTTYESEVWGINLTVMKSGKTIANKSCMEGSENYSGDIDIFTRWGFKIVESPAHE
jgi:hypothetical protein